jgi:hypothetical protein
VHWPPSHAPWRCVRCYRFAGAAAIGAVVGVLVLGEWFIGVGLAAWLAAWLALPIPTNTLVTRDVIIRRSRLRR